MRQSDITKRIELNSIGSEDLNGQTKILKRVFKIYVFNKVTLFCEKNVLKNPRKHFITKQTKLNVLEQNYSNWNPRAQEQ